MKITLELDTLALNESDKAVLRAIARCESKSSENEHSKAAEMYSAVANLANNANAKAEKESVPFTVVPTVRTKNADGTVTERQTGDAITVNINGAMFVNEEQVKDAIECGDNLSQEQIDKAKEDINSVIGGMNMTAEQAEQLIKIVRTRIRK